MNDEIEFVSDRERVLFARAKLGEDIQGFLRSPTGRYLHGRAKADYEEAKQALIEASPFKFLECWKIRQRAKQSEQFMKYCVDAIQDGEIAFQEMQQEK